MNLFSLFRLSVAAVCLPISALSASPPYEFTAIYYPGKLELKGDLSDPAWKDAPEYTGFLRKNGVSPKAQTFVKILYDNENIYFGVRFEEPEPSSILRQHDQNDLAIYNDDCFELVFDTRGTPETFYHFVVNHLGAIFDSKNSDKNWSSYKAKSKSTLGKGEWMLELAIPFSDLDVPTPIFGEKWTTRLARERKTVQENTAIPPTDAGLFIRKDLAPLIFQNSPRHASEVQAETSATGVSFGGNSISVTLRNSSSKAVKTTLSTTASGAGNRVLNEWKEAAIVPANGETKIVLDIPVETDELERVSLTLSDENGSALWGQVLMPEFKKGRVAVHELKKKLPLYRADLLLSTTTGGAIFDALSEQINAFEGTLKAFADAVTEAIRTNTTVPIERWEEVKKAAETFDKWATSREIALWEADPWENGSPSYIPEKLPEAPVTLNFRQAGNEREARAIELTGLLPGGRKDLRFAIEDMKLVGDDRSFLSRDHILIYHSPWVRDGFNRLINDPLVQSENYNVAVSAGKTERVWVVFDSKGVAPGQYEGAIVIKPVDTAQGRRQDWQRIALKVTVENFELPQTRDWPLDTYLFGPGIQPSNEMELLRLFDAYHVNWMMTNRFAYMWESQRDGTHWIADPKRRRPRHLFYDPAKLRSQDTFLKEAQRRGMKLLFGWNATRNLEWYDEMLPYLKSIGFDEGDYAFQGMGDEFPASKIPEYMEFHRPMHKQHPSARFMATLTSVPPPTGATFEELEEPAKYVSIWNHHLARLWPADSARSKENMKWFRDRNLTIWGYVCATQMQNWPVNDYYRLAPWRAYLAGLDGISMWISMASKGDGLDHGDGYDEGLLFRGINRAPISSKRMEALREGLEDVAIMAILKERLAAHRIKDPKADLSKYEALISEVPLGIEKAPSTSSIKQWRDDVMDAIGVLSTH